MKIHIYYMINKDNIIIVKEDKIIKYEENNMDLSRSLYNILYYKLLKDICYKFIPKDFVTIMDHRVSNYKKYKIISSKDSSVNIFNKYLHNMDISLSLLKYIKYKIIRESKHHAMLEIEV